MGRRPLNVEETGRVICGINNIFLVGSEGTRERVECRIKGKILRDSTAEYNPLTAGDYVLFERETSDRGMILSRLPRKNSFSRWNIKGRLPQTIGANIDLLVCMGSPDIPPFRPRFMDRVLVAAERESIPSALFINKMDQRVPEGMSERLEDYARLNYRVFYGSVLSKQIDSEFLDYIAGKTVLLFGQSGVGKSTLINRLVPDAVQKTSEVSEKYRRGRHTTTFSLLLDIPSGGSVIDSPGVRDFFMHDLGPENVSHCFPEMASLAKGCRYRPCTHIHEPDCAVRDGVAKGEIHPDRYESYCRILEELNKS